MNNKIVSNLLSFMLGSFIIFSFAQCADNDDATGASTVTATSNPTLSLDWSAPSSLTETDASFPFTVTMSQAQIADVHIDVSIVEATATEGDDFNYTHGLIIKAGETTASGSFDVKNDLIPEGTETVTIQVGSERLANASFSPQTFTVSIGNFISPDIAVIYTWDAPFVFGGTTYTLCPNVDADLYIFDSAGNNLAGYDMATSACPEEGFLTNYGKNAGTIQIYADLWSNALTGLGLAGVEYPDKLTFIQAGAGTAELDISNVLNWNGDTVADNNGGDTFTLVATYVYTDSSLVISDINGNVVKTFSF